MRVTEIALLNKNYKGVFIVLDRKLRWYGIHFHFKNHTRRIYIYKNKLQTDRYSTIGFNKSLQYRREFDIDGFREGK